MRFGTVSINPVTFTVVVPLCLGLFLQWAGLAVERDPRGGGASLLVLFTPNYSLHGTRTVSISLPETTHTYYIQNGFYNEIFYCNTTMNLVRVNKPTTQLLCEIVYRYLLHWQHTVQEAVIV